MPTFKPQSNDEMAKKRKASGHVAKPDTSNGWGESRGKMKPIKSYEDVADSEDEFHINRDKIMLDDGPEAKRRRKWQEEDAQLEASDEEILAYSESEDEDVEDEDDIEDEPNQPDVSDTEGQEEDEEEGWGLSKKDYYNNDEILTEEQAREEEEEARRIQQKRLAKMTAADFGLDDFDFEGAKDDGEYEKGDVITEVLPDIEITPEMGPEERYGILQSRYPEFDFLADEFLALHPLLEDLKKQVEAQPPRALLDPLTTTEIKCRALVAYLSCLAMYFGIFASPARDRGINKPLPPDELQDHEVMDTLLQCRQTWNKVKSLKAPTTLVPKPEEPISVPDTQSSEEIDKLAAEPTMKSRKQKAIEVDLSAASKQRAQRLEADLSSLNALLPRSLKKPKPSRPVTFIHESDNSDFGEEDVLSTRDAATKAQRKKNLSFYTSQIAQKANKRGLKGREAGGDEDVPHRERLRDRQDRLNREAEARAKKFDSYGRGKGTDADLGAGSDDEVQNGVATKVRGEEDEYYDLISKTSKAKKAAKETERAAIREAKAQNALVRVVEGEMDEEGKRAIGYVIEKNKGLAPKRKKDVRNPRVKKRKKFEEKKKKLASTRAVFKGGEERGGYGGEKTGIKTGLVKSVKL